MKRSLLDVLVSPATGETLECTVEEGSDEVISGTLKAGNGTSYRIDAGIPRFMVTTDRQQLQTADTFGYKWKKEESYASDKMNQSAAKWLVDRYGFKDLDDMRSFFASRSRILDAGCGAAFSACLWLTPEWNAGSSAEWVGLEISEAVDVACKRLKGIPSLHFVQGDILSPPFAPESFDAIFSEGVLHHTPSTRDALASLTRLLRRGGEMMVYVYRRKAPVREFTDAHIRAALSPQPPKEAWEALRPLTELARQLTELKANVTITEPIPYLGIEPGTYDLQRFLYWNFLKLFWNEEFTFEENLHVNFDWYHPRYAWTHTEEELRAWCQELGLEIHHFDAQESGFTFRARRA